MAGMGIGEKGVPVLTRHELALRAAVGKLLRAVDIQGRSKRQRDGNDTRTGFPVTDGFEHQLLDGLISEPRPIS